MDLDNLFEIANDLSIAQHARYKLSPQKNTFYRDTHEAVVFEAIQELRKIGHNLLSNPLVQQ